jgi:SAM-dependent methyltransferase
MGSLLAARIWVFITPIVRDVAYEELPADFYHDTTKSEQVGAFRAWYHGGRYQELQAQVHSLYTEGDSIYDFGCGGAQWNQSKLPVIGVDVSRGLLQYGKDRGQLRDIVVAELDKTGLPDACADIIIISEVIEHIVDPVKVLHEIHRCLKPGGRLIATVPWDTPFSPFFWLFNVQCFYRGHIVGEEYYKQRCGHINHFSLRRLKKLLTQTGFSVQRMYRFRGFLLYSISTK